MSATIVRRFSTFDARVHLPSAEQIVKNGTCEGISCLRCPLYTYLDGCTDGGGELGHDSAAADWLIDFKLSFGHKGNTV